MGAENPGGVIPLFELSKNCCGIQYSLYHLHINPKIAAQDLNTLLPLQPFLNLNGVGKSGVQPTIIILTWATSYNPELARRICPCHDPTNETGQVNIVILVPG